MAVSHHGQRKINASRLVAKAQNCKFRWAEKSAREVEKLRPHDEKAGVQRDTPTMLRDLAEHLRCCARELSRFRRSGRGTTAVEYALIAPAFLATLIAVLQTCVFAFAQRTLQNAAMQAGRLIMTGQVQSGNVTQKQFQNNVCPMIKPLFNCNALMVDVQSYSSLSGAVTSTPPLTYNGQGQVTNSWSYNPGTPGQVVIVRLIYQWSVVGGPLGFMLSNLPNGYSEMMGISAFRAEPYSS
jgi:Flp pilus assembly protein TadG